MVLDRYFSAQAQLKAMLPAVRNLRKLAHGNDTRSVNRLIDSISGLPNQFRISLVGAGGTGKSTFAEAWSQYASNPKSLTWDTCLLTEDNPIHSYPVSRRQSLERASAVVVVIDVLDPWEPLPIQFLKRLPKTWLEKSVVAFFRSDLRDKDELNANCRHLSVELQTPGGTRLSPVTVSARLAALAPEAADQKRLASESGFADFAGALGEAISRHTECISKVTTTLALARNVLSTVGNNADRIATDMEATEAVLFRLDEAVDTQKTPIGARLHPVLGAVDSEFMAAVVELEEALVSNSGNDAFAPLAGVFQARIGGAIDSAQKEAAAVIEEDLEVLWQEIVEHLREIQMVAFDSSDLRNPVGHKQRREFLRAGQSATNETTRAIQLEKAMADTFKRKRRLWFRAKGFAACAIVATGALLWVTSQNPIAVAVACLAVTAFAYTLFRRCMRRWQEDARQTLWDYLDGKREQIQQTLSATFAEHTPIYFDSLHQRIEQLRSQAERIHKKRQPALSGYAEIERLVGRIEDDWE